jgi:hypothetical protein
LKHRLKHPWQHLGGTVAFPDCGTVLPLGFPSLGFEGLGFPFPSSPFRSPWVAGFRIAGTLGLGWLPLAGLECRDSLAWLRGFPGWLAWLPLGLWLAGIPLLGWLAGTGFPRETGRQLF